MQDASNLAGDLYFYHLASGESELQTSVGDALFDFATGVSQDGRISALHGVPVQAGVYSDAGGWLDLESPFPAGCDANIGAAWDLSPFFGLPVAFVWTAEDGMRALEEIAIANGITLPGTFKLTSVTAASADGSVLLGVALDETNNQKSFVLELPVSAY